MAVVLLYAYNLHMHFICIQILLITNISVLAKFLPFDFCTTLNSMTKHINDSMAIWYALLLTNFVSFCPVHYQYRDSLFTFFNKTKKWLDYATLITTLQNLYKWRVKIFSLRFGEIGLFALFRNFTYRCL